MRPRNQRKTTNINKPKRTRLHTGELDPIRFLFSVFLVYFFVFVCCFFGFLDYFLVRCLFEGLAKQHKGQDLTLCHFSQFRVANLFLVAFCLLWV